MKELDDELRHALRREPAPTGFAERVLQRAENEAKAPAVVVRPEWGRRRLSRPLVRLAAAAALIAAVAGGIQYRNYENARAERAAGEAARDQVLEALRITASKLQLVQAKVREAGS